MADLTGKDVGRYHVVEKLGQGGMAEVYKAYDIRLEREVALKVIRKDVIGSAFHEAMMKRFEREARALARLSHPNIVQVFDYGSYKGAPYLVMEYLPGGVLSLKVHGILAYPEAARLLAPVARALECAHEEGILHRDVKPANILLTRQGQPKLSDFGIAKMLDVEGSTQLTGTNMGIGTPEYMAPEQWMGKPVPQTDIYALGVVFYELVTGRRPYTADTPLAVMQKQLTDPLPRPREHNPALPEAVEEVLFKALAKNPADRYNSMGEFAAVLDRLALGVVETPAMPPIMPVSPIDQTQPADMRKKKVPPAPPPGALVIPTHQPEPLPVAHSRVIERAGQTGSKAWKLTAGVIGGGVLVLGLLVMAGILIWTSQFSVEAQARRTATAGTQAVEQTAGETTALAALWTETPSVTPTLRYIPTPKLGDTQVSEKDGMVMVWVPEGEFSMGSDNGESSEKPVHAVYLDGYWMDRTEVTNTMFRRFVEVIGYQTEAEKLGKGYAYTDSGNWEEVSGADWQHPQGPASSISRLDDHPVVQVSWNDANAYCEWAGRNLPSEAQWEKAARGTDGRTYPWGEAAPNGSLLNFADRNLDKEFSDPGSDDGYKYTAPVASYPAGVSPYGIMDLAGNVWEWVADWYGETYYSSSPDSNPQGPASGSYRILRGGSWDSDDYEIRAACRSGGSPDSRGSRRGFRCSRSQ